MNNIIIQWENKQGAYIQNSYTYTGTDIDAALSDWKQTIQKQYPGATIIVLYPSFEHERLFPTKTSTLPAPPAPPAVLETNLSALVAIINLFHHLHYLFADDDNLENPNEIATTFSRLATQFDKIREGTKIQ